MIYDEQELEEKITKSRTQLTNSQSLTHSNSELNSICPHKGSTKSKKIQVERAEKKIL